MFRVMGKTKEDLAKERYKQFHTPGKRASEQDPEVSSVAPASDASSSSSPALSTGPSAPAVQDSFVRRDLGTKSPREHNAALTGSYSTPVVGSESYSSAQAQSGDSAFPGARRHTVVFDVNLLGGPVVRKGGYLVKQGYERKSWKRRFFTLAGHNLHYFQDDNMTEKLGMIPLAGCKIVLQPNLKQHCFSVSHAHRRTYYLCADSEHQMQDWIHEILEVINEIGDEDTLKGLQTDDLPEFQDLLLAKAKDFPEVAMLLKKADGPTKCVRLSLARLEGLPQLDEKYTHIYCEFAILSKQADKPITVMVSPYVPLTSSPELQSEYYFSMAQLKDEIAKIRIVFYVVDRNSGDVYVYERQDFSQNAADTVLGEIVINPYEKILKAEKKSASIKWEFSSPLSKKSKCALRVGVSWTLHTPQELCMLGREKLVEGNNATAKQLYELAAESHFSPALSALAWWYTRGYEGKSLISKGFELYQKAAAQGDPVAQNNLGHCYQHGIGVSADSSLAKHWYCRAGEQHDFYPALVNLGSIMLSTAGDNKKEVIKARGFFEKAAAHNLPEGQNNFAYCLQTGTGGATDMVRAVELFRLSAEAGYLPALHNLGQCYEYGLGVEADAAVAIGYYKKAAERGHAGGMLACGLCYERGVGVAKDTVEARKWYEKAVSAGDTDAAQKLVPGDYVF